MAQGHSNMIGAIVGEDWSPIVTASLVTLCLVGLFKLARIQLAQREVEYIPEKTRFRASTFFELFAEFFRKLGDNVMGEKNREYLPFIASVFIYIFFMNLLGLIPGFATPVTLEHFGFLPVFNLGIATVVFAMYNWWGIKKSGISGYLKHFLGPIAWLAPVMLGIELISHFVRPLSLSLRLFGNMQGDHQVLAIFTELTKFGIPIIFYFLGAFVCFMQAFIFTLLSMVYIRLAVESEDH